MNILDNFREFLNARFGFTAFYASGKPDDSTQDLKDQLYVDAIRSWKVKLFCADEQNSDGMVAAFQQAFYLFLCDVWTESYYQGAAAVLEVVCLAHFDFQFASERAGTPTGESAIAPIPRQEVSCYFKNYPLLLAQAKEIIDKYIVNDFVDIAAQEQQVEQILEYVKASDAPIFKIVEEDKLARHQLLQLSISFGIHVAGTPRLLIQLAMIYLSKPKNFQAFVLAQMMTAMLRRTFFPDQTHSNHCFFLTGFICQEKAPGFVMKLIKQYLCSSSNENFWLRFLLTHNSI